MCDALQQVLTQAEMQIEPAQVKQLAQYCELLWSWNEKLNLTRHTDYDKFVNRDLVDCQQLSAMLSPGESVLDVGSGGGVPGVVLGILRPDLKISLCESVGKKAAALEDIVAGMNLPLNVIPHRAEDILVDFQFDTLVTRAVGPLWKMLKWFQPHWKSIGRLLAVKGPRWIEERGEARHRGFFEGLELRKAVTYRMPGTESESVILQIRRKAKRSKQ